MKMIAFYPYLSYGVNYSITMQRLLQSKCEVVDYVHLKYGLWDVSSIDCIYLNWIEDCMDDNDVSILQKAKKEGIRIVWVFHNKKTHDSEDNITAISNIRFLANISDAIVIHSKNSGLILAEECEIPYESLKEKIYYIPHPNYIGDYRDYVYPGKGNRFLPSSRKITFAFIGLVRPYKNIEALLRAYKGIRDSVDCRLVIAGRFSDENYYKAIKMMCNGYPDISIVPQYIGPLEMGALLSSVDIVLMPYSLNSSLNSGAMIMAFSYKKTVIVSDICMTDDFPEDLIFKYHYETEEEHVMMLKTKMLDACKMGSTELKRRGEKLYEIVLNDCNKELVGKNMFQICEL